MSAHAVEALDGSAARSGEGLGSHLRQLVGLGTELMAAEARAVVVRAALAAGLGAAAVAALPAALTVMLAAALAPTFSSPWQPLAAAGAATLTVSCATITWSIWYLRRLRPPREALSSILEQGRWLAAELKFRPISRLFGR